MTDRVDVLSLITITDDDSNSSVSEINIKEETETIGTVNQSKTITVPDIEIETDRISKEDDLEDIPDDFFDDFSNDDFMAGLDVVDTWVPDVGSKDIQDIQSDVEKTEKINASKESANIIETDENKESKIFTTLDSRMPPNKLQKSHYLDSNEIIIFRTVKSSERSCSKQKEISSDLGRRRDPNKATRDICKDKERIVKEKNAKQIQALLNIVQTGLVPPGTELECTGKGIDKEDITDENEKGEMNIEKRISPIRYISSKRRISAVRNVRMSAVLEKNLKIIINEGSNVPMCEYNILRSRESRSRSRSILKYKRRRIDEPSRSRETKYHRYSSNGRREKSLEICGKNIERHEGEMDSINRRSRCRDRIIRSHRNRSRSYHSRNRSRDSRSRSGDRLNRSHRSRSRSYYSRNHSRNSRSRTRNRISRSRRSYHSRNCSRNSRSGRSERYRYERRSRSSEKYRQSRKRTLSEERIFREFASDLSLSSVSNMDNRYSSFSSSADDLREPYKKQRSPFIVELERKFRQESEERRILKDSNNSTHNEESNQIQHQNQKFFQHPQQVNNHIEFVQNRIFPDGAFVPDGPKFEFGSYGPAEHQNIIPFNSMPFCIGMAHSFGGFDIHQSIQPPESQYIVEHGLSGSFMPIPQVYPPSENLRTIHLGDPIDQIDLHNDDITPDRSLGVLAIREDKNSPKKSNEMSEPNLEQLFAEKKISLSDFLTVSSKGLESTEIVPVPALKKIKVVSRVEDAILKLENYENKKTRLLIFKNSKNMLSEIEKAEMDCTSPFRRITSTASINFTTPALYDKDKISSYSARIQQVLMALEMKLVFDRPIEVARVNRLSGVQLINDQVEIIDSDSDAFEPLSPSAINFNRSSGHIIPIKRKIYATSIAIQTDMPCQECEDRKSISFRDMGNQTERKTGNVNTYVNEKILLNSCFSSGLVNSAKNISPTNKNILTQNISPKKGVQRPFVNSSPRKPGNSPRKSQGVGLHNVSSSPTRFMNNRPLTEPFINTDGIDTNTSNYDFNHISEIIKQFHVGHNKKGNSVHSGIRKTYSKMREQYNFPNMNQLIRSYISNCEVCKRKHI